MFLEFFWKLDGGSNGHLSHSASNESRDVLNWVFSFSPPPPLIFFLTMRNIAIQNLPMKVLWFGTPKSTIFLKFYFLFLPLSPPFNKPFELNYIQAWIYKSVYTLRSNYKYTQIAAKVVIFLGWMSCSFFEDYHPLFLPVLIVLTLKILFVLKDVKYLWNFTFSNAQAWSITAQGLFFDIL